ncbi:MAG: polysaccharide pyruvyl transferase family protein [Akkermansia sp.]|nr:polysaccharide pyruvyl transferase family protein [Akkermansia sp.]
MTRNTYILTHPLTGNYGGLLQAYACYTTLNKCGVKAHIFHYQPNDIPTGIWPRVRRWLQHLKYCAGLSKNAHTLLRRLQIAGRFVKGMRFSPESRLADQGEQDSYVVGSDQVWRAIYCRMMKTPAYYFLDFATPEQRRKSIAYSASFGVDHWEGTPEETEECKRLLQEFKAVSVREHSGVDICREVFGVEAVQMPDPTLLLQKAEYDELIAKEKTWAPATPFLASYVLDENPEKLKQLQTYAQGLNVTLQHLLPHAGAAKRRDRFAHTVGQWLRLIRDAEYFITDSFHGCAFAIIFNKPFVCLGNEKRGSARFDSLLGTFGLKDRLAINPTPEQVRQILNTPVDWDKVNAIRRSEQERAFEFLRKNLE